MWNTEEKIREKKMALAGVGCVQSGKKEKEKLSRPMAMVMGIILTIEIMIAGAMMLNLDFGSADIIALVMAFVVLYFGVVAALTDK